MRKYEKPVMQVERYEVKNAIATGCYEQEYVEYPSQTVKCIINGSENIFDTEYFGSGCKNDASQGHLGSDGTNYYFTWYNGSVSGEPTAAQTAELARIANICGVSLGQNTPGWHAGTIDVETYKQMNSTS